MGTGRWSSDDWATYSAVSSTKSTGTIFKSRSLKKDLSPHGIGQRESRDSALNPNSNAIIVALDVTGSMGMVATEIARHGLGTMVEEILKRKPVSDPHIMLQAIGDVKYDSAPLQVTQFEADNTLVGQLESIYVEGGGGGNHCESYNLPWYFAAMHTSVDCFEKRGKKGYLFTVGDEQPPADLLAREIEAVMGTQPERDYTSRELLTMAERMYHVFHIVVEEGSHFRSNGDKVMSTWTDLLGQRVIRLKDHKKLAEVVVSTIQVIEGADAAAVTKSWSGDTSLVVAAAVNGLTKAGGSSTGVVRF